MRTISELLKARRIHTINGMWREVRRVRWVQDKDTGERRTAHVTEKEDVYIHDAYMTNDVCFWRGAAING